MWEDKERMKKQTEEHIKSMPIVRMKHFDGVFGMASYREGKYLLMIDGKDEPIVFNTIAALSDAGWTID